MPIGILRPLRIAEIRDFARKLRTRYQRMTLDEIAAKENIILIRTSSGAKEDGFSFLERTSALLDKQFFIRSIVINKNSPKSEEEIFWHEFYHLLFSQHQDIDW